MVLVGELQSLLSDGVTVSLKTQGCHWNVEGPDFAQYHELFASIYEDVDGMIDPVAENIRKLRGYAPFTLEAFMNLRQVGDSEMDTNPLSMSRSLLGDLEVLIASVNRVFQVAVDENEQGIANYLSEQDNMLKKWAWQLRASVTGV